MSPAVATLLLTGAGSLVGTTVLDCLDGRRDSVRLVGLNLDVTHPNLARCDMALQAPPTDDTAAYRASVLSAIEESRADLVIPCRDPDVQLLAGIAAELPELAPRLLVGSTVVADMVSDKVDSSVWARTREVSFAVSVPTGEAASLAAGLELLADHGFPLIAKPRRGSGSLGVRVLTQRSQLETVATLDGLVLQPYHDPPSPEELHLDLALGVPLFWEVPVPRQFGCQVLIGPDGRQGPRMAFKAVARMGRVEVMEQWHDPGLLDLAERAARAAIADGWRGPLNIQARPTRDGWAVIEFNGRFTGGTSCRYRLGLDEVGWSVNTWLGRTVIPPPTREPARRVITLPSDHPVW